MNSDAAVAQQPPGPPQYARFVRRFRAMVIDWIIMIVVIFGALFVATIVHTDGVTRPLGWLVVIAFLLYEPVLVCMTGSTIGHYYANLRVIDDRHHGNVSFLKAVARFVIKSLLGWYSFIAMTLTRRNQALHDQLTRSTVQMRDPAKARPDHYITERTDFTNPNMPSRTRRVLVILVYLLLAFVIFAASVAILSVTGVVSAACETTDRCTLGENIARIGSGLMWLALSALLIVLGWKGKLLGARLRTQP